MFTLVVTIVLMSILSGAAIYVSNRTIKTGERTRFAIEILNIQNSVENYYLENGKYPTSETVDFNTANLGVFEISQFIGENISENIITLSKLDLNALGIRDTEFGNNIREADVYAISNITGRVYYIEGVTHEYKTYYSMHKDLYQFVTDDISKMNKNDIRIKDVIFRVSDLEMSSKPITITLLLPLDATIDAITTTNEVEFGEESQEDEYKIVEINTTNAKENYDVTVEYTLNANKHTVVYNVTNSDYIGPVIAITEQKNDGYISLNINATDDLSGLAKLKYEFTNVEDASYFIKYGKTINGTKLDCYESGTYTIYAIDNAGNATLVKHDVVI